MILKLFKIRINSLILSNSSIGFLLSVLLFNIKSTLFNITFILSSLISLFLDDFINNSINLYTTIL